jgi:hypothetical protein
LDDAVVANVLVAAAIYTVLESEDEVNDVKSLVIVELLLYVVSVAEEE